MTTNEVIDLPVTDVIENITLPLLNFGPLTSTDSEQSTSDNIQGRSNVPESDESNTVHSNDTVTDGTMSAQVSVPPTTTCCRLSHIVKPPDRLIETM